MVQDNEHNMTYGIIFLYIYLLESQVNFDMDISLRMKEDFELDKDNIEINKYTLGHIMLIVLHHSIGQEERNIGNYSIDKLL